MVECDRPESDGERELSDSDSEPELDPSEYEKRRENFLRQIILAEVMFNKMKVLLRDMKIKQLMKRRQDVLNGTDPEFMVKQRELLEEFNARNKVTEAIRGLELDSLERRSTGLKKIAETSQDDNRIIALEKLREEILNEIRSEKERQVQERIVKAFFQDERFELKRGSTECGSKRPFKRRRFKKPGITGELPPEEIEADLRCVDLAILIADAKEDFESKEKLISVDV